MRQTTEVTYEYINTRLPTDFVLALKMSVALPFVM
jgi:hypothetical protein